MKIELVGIDALTECQLRAVIKAASITLEVDAGREDRSEKRLSPRETVSACQALEKLEQALRFAGKD